MTGTMTHNILLTRFQGGKKQCLLTRGWIPEETVPYTPWAGRGGKDDSNIAHFLTTRLAAFTPPSAECYAIQAFSIASDFDPKLMPKIQNQITMRKVCIVIQSLLSRRLSYTLKRRKNVVYEITNVEQHELLGFDASCQLPDVFQELANSLAIVEGVLSRFF